MGEANRKKRALAQAAALAQAVNPPLLARAVQQVVRACTDFYGADCLLFAAIGAGALGHLGYAAHPVAGSAIWRIGPGDGDTISHARELASPLYMQGVAKKALQFHAWVEAEGLLVDFSTCTLPLKAAQLDAADGGHTRVDWAPDFLWLNAGNRPSHLAGLADVTQSFDVGVYHYLRHPDIEAEVMPDIPALMAEQTSAIATAVTVYRALCAGRELHVAGVGSTGVQTEPALNDLVLVRKPTA